MKSIALAALALMLGTALYQKPVAAHPHVWVTAETEIEFNAKKEITGFNHKWIFDEYFTSFATAGLDKNGDGIYSREELQELAKTNVEALAEFGYFTFPAAGEQKLGLKAPVEYHLEYKNDLLTLHFRLPLEKPVTQANIKNFSFSVYDPGYYVAVTWNKKSPIRLASAQPIKCTPQLRSPQLQIKQATFLQTLGENIDPASNIGASFAEKIEIDCKG